MSLPCLSESRHLDVALTKSKVHGHGGQSTKSKATWNWHAWHTQVNMDQTWLTNPNKHGWACLLDLRRLDLVPAKSKMHERGSQPSPK